jgi:hypothetical protein
MPINFPTSPTPNQTYTVGSRTWTWNDTNGTWDATSVTQGIQGITGTQGSYTTKTLTYNTGTLSAGQFKILFISGYYTLQIYDPFGSQISQGDRIEFYNTAQQIRIAATVDAFATLFGGVYTWTILGSVENYAALLNSSPYTIRTGVGITGFSATDIVTVLMLGGM